MERIKFVIRPGDLKPDWEHIHDLKSEQSCGSEPGYLWMAKIRTDSRSGTKNTEDRRTNTNGMDRWGVMSMCSEFRVSNLRSTVKVWPLSFCVQHRSIGSPCLSVIYKVSDLSGRCHHAFTHWCWRLMHWDEWLLAVRESDVSVACWHVESSSLEAEL